MINKTSGQLELTLERGLFTHRIFVLAVCSLLTLILGYKALDTRIDASFERMVPTNHPFLVNFSKHRNDLEGLGNSLRIAVENKTGSIFDQEFQETLRAIHDEVFYISGVDRAGMRSIWSPGVRWQEVTEKGFAGGPVVPADYDGSPEALEQLKTNVLRSGVVGTLVSNDFSSALIIVPLLEGGNDGDLSYEGLSRDLEATIRQKYENEQIGIYITGFAKIVGDLIEGAGRIAAFFVVAVCITFGMLLWYSRCLRSSLFPVFCSITAVIWQLGILGFANYGLDPYSMLVPFLVFAIGVSHSVQIINNFSHEYVKSRNRIIAGRLTFRSLYKPGIIALISDAAGFATLLIIDIEVIQQLAVTASIGVLVIICTNLILLPILLSFFGVGRQAQDYIGRDKSSDHSLVWGTISKFATRNYAGGAILGASVLLAVGLTFSPNLKIGDLDRGAPELRADSRYNLDNDFITEKYSTSSDVFVVMAVTNEQSVAEYEVMDLVDQFHFSMSQVTGVQGVSSLSDVSKNVLVGLNEGNIRWYGLNKNQNMLNSATMRAPSEYVNSDATLTPIFLYLSDHKAETLSRIVKAVEEFNFNSSSNDIKFLMAAGNSGIEAATNEVISEAQYEMLIWIYAVVGGLCMITFRSLKTVLCILIPLALTSILCQALMAWLGIGVKVATLPVIALGVGIGVDYGIYIYSKLNHFLSQGYDFANSYSQALVTTGRAVAFTGITLAIGVGTWAFSPIKFQADMGILLTFMFIVNMIGALVLLPALAYLFSRPMKKSQAFSSEFTK